MERLVKGDIIVVEFPFSNLKESKRRPALVLQIPKGEDVIVNQITSSPYEKSIEVKIEDEDFMQGGLRKESFVRLDKIGSIEKSLIKYKAGTLKQEKFEFILNSVCDFLKN